MIARMSKYDFILYAGQSDDFIARLRELGLVDVTCTGWEPTDEDRALITSIENRTKAVEQLTQFRTTERFDASAAPLAADEDPYACYRTVTQRRAALHTEIAQTEKSIEEARPWGEFSTETLQRLSAQGVTVRFFTTQRNTFEQQHEAWSEQAAIEAIAEDNSTVWFVAVTRDARELSLDAQEVKAPTMTVREAEAKRMSLQAELAATDRELSRVAVSMEGITAERNRLRERLQGVKVTATAASAADTSSPAK